MTQRTCLKYCCSGKVDLSTLAGFLSFFHLIDIRAGTLKVVLFVFTSQMVVRASALPFLLDVTFTGHFITLKIFFLFKIYGMCPLFVSISINGTPTFECEVSKIGTEIIIENNTHNAAQDQINMIAGVKLAITENGSPKSLSSRIQILDAADVKSGLTDAYDNATP